MQMRHVAFWALLFMAGTGCGVRFSPAVETSPPKAEGANPGGRDWAEAWGWSAEYTRGQEVLRGMEALRPDQRGEHDITAFRGERIAFLAGPAPAGGTNDLIIRGGYYLRIVNPANKDLRPHAVYWIVMVRGKIQQVLPRNRLIVLEVNQDDYRVVETM